MRRRATRSTGRIPSSTRRPRSTRNSNRVFDICHGCRRCVSLCQAFPTLFDLVDESSTMEVDGVDKADYAKVVEQCYLCDLCYQTKCPYVPPHPWNVDFPHLMLRAKAARHKRGETKLAAKMLVRHDDGRKDRVDSGRRRRSQRAQPRQAGARKLLEKTLGVHPRRARAGISMHAPRASVCKQSRSHSAAERNAGRPHARQGGDLRHLLLQRLASGIRSRISPRCSTTTASPCRLVEREVCCGMPKLELGDLDSVEKYKETNIPVLAAAVRDGWDITAAIPSCVLMFKQELPLMFPDDEDVQLVKRHIFDPFEYLWQRHQARTAEDRLQEPARQGRLARALPPARAEHRPEDARRARAGSRHRSRSPSNAAPATTAPTA